VDNLRTRLKELIVRVLMLEGVTPADIGDEDRLFGGGLGLDSVDALELAIHIEEDFGVKMPDDERSREAFASIAALARYIDGARPAAAVGA
jgi:acyl carrier protein